MKPSSVLGILPLLFSILLFPASILRSSHYEKRSPSDSPWWEICIELSAKGEYQIREGSAVYIGRYSFRIDWKGTMELDDYDFILYQDKEDLKEWKAAESAEYPNSSATITHEEFKGIPSLHVNYVLREKNVLIFNLAVDGIKVPQNKSCVQQVLPLPLSNENTNKHPKLNYNDYIIDGSNLLVLKASKLNKIQSKKFWWRWKNHHWEGKVTQSQFISTEHNASVKIDIIPHYEGR